MELFHFLRALEEWQSNTAGIHNKIRTQFGHNPCMSVYHTYGTRKYLLADATDEFDLPMVGILGKHPQVDVSCITECISSSLNVVQ